MMNEKNHTKTSHEYTWLIEDGECNYCISLCLFEWDCWFKLWCILPFGGSLGENGGGKDTIILSMQAKWA
jgi:hypothetical protein